MSAVQDSFEEVDYDNNIIEIDNDFDSYSKGVTLLVYSSSGELIKGSIPRGFPSYMPLTSGSYQEIEGKTGPGFTTIFTTRMKTEKDYGSEVYTLWTPQPKPFDLSC